MQRLHSWVDTRRSRRHIAAQTVLCLDLTLSPIQHRSMAAWQHGSMAWSRKTAGLLAARMLALLASLALLAVFLFMIA